MTDSVAAELEIGLHRSLQGHMVQMRFSEPATDGNAGVLTVTHGLAKFDLLGLQSKLTDPNAYGKLLTESLFTDATVRDAFVEARTRAGVQGVTLRLQLLVGPSAPELHGLRWETLGDPPPGDGGWLATSEYILFSRLLSSLGHPSVDGSQRVRLRPKTELRSLAGLVVIANPLGDIKVKAEEDRARQSLDGIQLRTLSSGARDATPTPAPPTPAPPTLNNIVAGVRHGCDILYLVCHGTVQPDDSRLLLEDDQGKAAWVSGTEFVSSLRRLPQLPRLVVLVSCRSAGQGTTGTGADHEGEEFRNALGPRLAEIGIPAVLAMQGDVSMGTAEKFVPTFFAELWKDGQVDRAMAVARGTVRDRPDRWMPVLFMRLRSGRLWYTPRLTAQDGGAVGWLGLLSGIRNGKATPILGPGLAEALTGSRAEIAERWAELSGYPMESYYHDDLPRVAQYLQVTQGGAYPREQLGEELRQEVRRRLDELISREGGRLPEQLRDDMMAKLAEGGSGSTLVDLGSALAELRRELYPAEPHRVLAELDCPLYVTTNIGNALFDALTAAGKDPQFEVCRWNEYLLNPPTEDEKGPDYRPSLYEREPDYQPSVDRPLIYHVFGHLTVEDSLVLTEDDYFDYLINIGRKQQQDAIPPYVRQRFASTALLFLGFQTDDWTFRVLFRTLMMQQGRALKERGRIRQIAVQLDVEEDRVASPRQARRYFERYFGEESIDVYWGSAEDFFRDLVHQRDRQGATR